IMKKASGLPPGIDKAVGDASLGKMGNSALPLTPAHIMGNKASGAASPVGGALNTGTWSAMGPQNLANTLGGRPATAPPMGTTQPPTYARTPDLPPHAR